MKEAEQAELNKQDEATDAGIDKPEPVLEDKVVDLQARKEAEAEAAAAQTRVEVTQDTRHIAQALRQLANKLEDGELNNLDFCLVIPKLVNGDLPMLFLGNPVPNIMLEGLLHRMLTKMSFQ